MFRTGGPTSKRRGRAAEHDFVFLDLLSRLLTAKPGWGTRRSMGSSGLLQNGVCGYTMRHPVRPQELEELGFCR